MIPVTPLINIKWIMLSERGQTQKAKYYRIPLTRCSQNLNLIMEISSDQWLVEVRHRVVRELMIKEPERTL